MKNVSDVELVVQLSPKTKLSKAKRENFWKNLLKAEFRESIGRLDIDHLVPESHVQFETENQMEVLVYKDASMAIGDDSYSVARSTQVERLVNAALRAVRLASGRTIDYKMSTLLHANLTASSSKRFLKENVRFSPTSKFRKAFGKYRGFGGFVLKITDNLSVAVSLPDHLDFVTTGVVKGGRRNRFISPFTMTCFRYIDRLGKK